MKHFVFLTFLLFPVLAFAGDVVIFDPATDRVTNYIRSAHTPDFDKRSDVVLNPDLSALSGVPIRYWKHSVGAIVEMSAAEKQVVDDAEVAATDALVRTTAKDAIDGFETNPILYRALIKVLLDEINLLREQLLLPPRTLSQAKTAIRNAIDGGTIDEKP